MEIFRSKFRCLHARLLLTTFRQNLVMSLCLKIMSLPKVMFSLIFRSHTKQMLLLSSCSNFTYDRSAPRNIWCTTFATSLRVSVERTFRIQVFIRPGLPIKWRIGLIEQGMLWVGRHNIGIWRKNYSSASGIYRLFCMASPGLIFVWCGRSNSIFDFSSL